MSDAAPIAAEGEDLRTTLEKIIDLLTPGPRRTLTPEQMERRRREMRQPKPTDVPLGTGLADEAADDIKTRRQTIEDEVNKAMGL